MIMIKKIIPLFPFGTFAGLLIAWFLSGKIINIPHGTHKGGIISAIGVLLIMVFSFALIYLFFRVTKSKERNVK